MRCVIRNVVRIAPADSLGLYQNFYRLCANEFSVRSRRRHAALPFAAKGFLRLAYLLTRRRTRNLTRKSAIVQEV